MGGLKTSQWRFLYSAFDVTSATYHHDVKRENLTFWLFQKSVKSDLC